MSKIPTESPEASWSRGRAVLATVGTAAVGALAIAGSAFWLISSGVLA